MLYGIALMMGSVLAQPVGKPVEYPAVELLQREVSRRGEHFRVDTTGWNVRIPTPEGTDFVSRVVELCHRSGGSILPRSAGESRSEDPIFGYLPSAPIAGSQSYFLVLRRAKRDVEVRSLVHLDFELITEKGAPIAMYDPHLKVVEGIAGNWFVESRHPTTWREAPQFSRRLSLSLRARNVKPKADKLEHVKLKFFYQAAGRGRSGAEAEFSFRAINIE